ncbi:MAG: zinc ribbon domain-containing protein [Phycisphaerae bacterium]|jgi:hypothetical protein|nr:zinc ribbon domain-containing protein [Phycisphaerae bacterium]
MPTYVYETVTKDGSEGKRFEISQSIKDPPLERHPETGEPVRRVVTLPLVLGTALGANAAAEGPSGGHCCGGGCGCGH